MQLKLCTKLRNNKLTIFLARNVFKKKKYNKGDTASIYNFNSISNVHIIK